MDNINVTEEIVETISTPAPITEQAVSEETEALSTRKNISTEIVSTVAYLIGIRDEFFEEGRNFEKNIYNSLTENKDATVIRHLCTLRNQFFLNYGDITKVCQSDSLKNYDDMPEQQSVESFKYLRANGISILKEKNIFVTVAYINQAILDRVDKLNPLFNDFVNFPYIRSLFLMPGCYSNNMSKKNEKANVKTKVGATYKNFIDKRKKYPFSCYINWEKEFGEKDGNILSSDARFLKLLYAANNDEFRGTRYVTDASDADKNNIYEFIDGAKDAMIFVDCENIDPYCFAAMFYNLDATSLKKIKQIVLFDDVHASTAWDEFEYVTKQFDIPLVHTEVNRLLENKSQVDSQLMLAVAKALNAGEAESFMIASSDSDFMILIDTFKNARFFILNEHSKTSEKTVEVLDEKNVGHCFIGDFALGKAQPFREYVLEKGVQKLVDIFNESGSFFPLNSDKIIDNLFHEARIVGSEADIKRQKSNFYDKYIKNIQLVHVLENGSRVIKMIIKK